MAAQTKSISFEDFTELTLKSVVRAIEVRDQLPRRFPLGPIIFGIIWYPESVIGLPGEILQQGGVARETGRK
jgi:hypothetical protein